MSGILLVDMQEAEAAAIAQVVESWTAKDNGFLGSAGKYVLDLAERVLVAPQTAWEFLQSPEKHDVTKVGQSVLALLAKVEAMIASGKALFDAGGIPESEWHGVRDRLRDTIVQFASKWPAAQPYGPEFAASLWRADFAFEDGERGRPLAEVCRGLKAARRGGP